MFVKELEITLENGMKISGELDLPERQGQWKTIILFHGSGPSDRHATVESMGGIVSRNFDLLSEGFVKARYAVFRYDKRENYDIEIIIRDAREVTRFVSGLSEVEGILFYGWSEGVRVCTTLVSDFPNAQALILQSGIAEGWSSYFSYILRELTVEKLKELDNNSDSILEISDFLNCIPDSTSISFSLYLLILGTDKEGNMKFNEELDPEGKVWIDCQIVDEIDSEDQLSFDLSVFDIFSVLGVGGTLVLPNPEKGPDASHWGRLLNEYKVTLWNSVPAQAEMLDAFASKSESYPTVRLVLLSGDWINTSLPGRLRKIMTNAQMISLGGATEGGIWSIYHEIDEIEERPTILYGKALLGQWMGVVDEELRICPEYVSGQIAIGGYSLAEGYLGDTTLTKEKFVYVEEEKNRIYLTGDNGRYVENGDIEFLGRLDNQVKINGHRIEIAEIENAIRGMQNIEDCCVVYNQSIGKGVLIAFIKNKISSISYTKEEYRKQLAFFLPPAMIPSEFVNVERFPLSTNGKIDRKGLAESIQKNIKVKHNAKATLISQKKEYVELAKSIKKIVCSISGNDYIDYEDNLLENGLDSLLLSQISGRIVSDIQEAQGMRFDEILRASLTMPTIMGIAQYISDCKNPSKNQMHSNAGNQTRNSYTVVYIFGDNENEIRDVLIEKLSASNISCKRVGGQEIIERCHEDISVKKKYIIAFSEMASLCITKASELLGENIIINRIFLINPSKAKESDLYLGDISIIDGNSVAIKSWEKAVLGNVREFESNSNDIFDIIMRELENDK